MSNSWRSCVQIQLPKNTPPPQAAEAAQEATIPAPVQPNPLPPLATESVPAENKETIVFSTEVAAEEPMIEAPVVVEEPVVQESSTQIVFSVLAEIVLIYSAVAFIASLSIRFAAVITSLGISLSTCVTHVRIGITDHYYPTGCDWQRYVNFV